MGRRPEARFNEKDLTKGELRKLNALRKSLGDEIAEKAFNEWYTSQADGETGGADKNAIFIADTLVPLIESEGLRIPAAATFCAAGAAA